MLQASLEAKTEDEVAAGLRAQGCVVLSIDQRQEGNVQLADLLAQFQTISDMEMVFFSRQLASLLRSGIPLTSALTSIADQTRNKLFRRTIETVLKDVGGGDAFSQALAKHPRFFAEIYVSMVRVGEVTGKMADVLERLTVLLEQSMDIKARVQSALTYPAILASVTVLIVCFLMINILPKFVVIFDSYGAQLPLSTRVLMGLSFFMQKCWMYVFAAGVAGGWIFGRYMRTYDGKRRVHGFLLRAPVFGALYMKVIVAQFTRSLSAMMKSGVPLLEALNVTQKTVPNVVVSRVISDAVAAIQQGNTLTAPFQASGVFPATLIQMMALGEKSGQLENMLEEVAIFYDKEVQYAVRAMNTVLEPLLLLGMGLMVAFIALSVLLPIFNLIKVFRH